MILVDLSYNAHCRANTGIQRVCRALSNVLIAKDQGIPITWDPYLGAWRPLDSLEKQWLSPTQSTQFSSKRKQYWTLGQKIKGKFYKYYNPSVYSLHGSYEALIVPEVLTAGGLEKISYLSKHIKGPRVALFPDLIPLKFPDLSSPKTITRLSSYLEELASFDGIASISEASREDLLQFWADKKIKNTPPVAAITLGIDSSKTQIPSFSKKPKCPKILCVGSIEGRKNHLSLLQAAELLWKKGVSFELILVGLLNQESGLAAKKYINQLQKQNYPVKWLGPVSEAVLEGLYVDAYFTVYPSLYEGYGLPVIESLIRGKPSVCTQGGALAETAKGGGCLQAQSPEPQAIASAIETLLGDSLLYESLANQIQARSFKTWEQYTQELMQFTLSL